MMKKKKKKIFRNAHIKPFIYRNKFGKLENFQKTVLERILRKRNKVYIKILLIVLFGIS